MPQTVWCRNSVSPSPDSLSPTTCSSKGINAAQHVSDSWSLNMKISGTQVSHHHLPKAKARFPKSQSWITSTELVIFTSQYTFNVIRILRGGKLENTESEMSRNSIHILGLSKVRWKDRGDYREDIKREGKGLIIIIGDCNVVLQKVYVVVKKKYRNSVKKILQLLWRGSWLWP